MPENTRCGNGPAVVGVGAWVIGGPDLDKSTPFPYPCHTGSSTLAVAQPWQA
jgi:hypothetical protein